MPIKERARERCGPTGPRAPRYIRLDSLPNRCSNWRSSSLRLFRSKPLLKVRPKVRSHHTLILSRALRLARRAHVQRNSMSFVELPRFLIRTHPSEAPQVPYAS